MNAEIIQGVFSIIVALIAAYGVGRGVIHQMQISQAVTAEKIAELTREVREHNDFARRMPVLEEKVDNIDHRVTRLEQKGA